MERNNNGKRKKETHRDIGKTEVAKLLRRIIIGKIYSKAVSLRWHIWPD